LRLERFMLDLWIYSFIKKMPHNFLFVVRNFLWCRWSCMVFFIEFFKRTRVTNFSLNFWNFGRLLNRPSLVYFCVLWVRKSREKSEGRVTLNWQFSSENCVIMLTFRIIYGPLFSALQLTFFSNFFSRFGFPINPSSEPTNFI
jgi:hypothetical protein